MSERGSNIYTADGETYEIGKIVGGRLIIDTESGDSLEVAISGLTISNNKLPVDICRTDRGDQFTSGRITVTTNPNGAENKFYFPEGQRPLEINIVNNHATVPIYFRSGNINVTVGSTAPLAAGEATGWFKCNCGCISFVASGGSNNAVDIFWTYKG